MKDLREYNVADYHDLVYCLKPYNNLVYLRDIWDAGKRKFLSTPSLIKKAILVETNGWFHLYYNSIDALQQIIRLLPDNMDIKFAALPVELWETVKKRWPHLLFIHHHVCHIKKKTLYPCDYPITPLQVEDIGFLVRNQPYIDEYGGESYLKHRIKKGLTACIRFKVELIAWEIFHDDGTMGFLRVKESYRRQGLGLAIQAYLANKVIDVGKKALGYVSIYNCASLRLMQELNMVAVDRVSWVRKFTPEEFTRYKQGIY